jgi:non-ribosomal peptide synthetase component E (peptide arylation enzyme)
LPDAIVRVPAMPLAMTGKIDKRRLRAEAGSSPKDGLAGESLG